MNIFTQIKLALQAKDAAEDIYKEATKMDAIKSGWKTSEFWFGVVLPKLILLIGYAKGVIPGPVFAWVMATIAGIYIMGRSVLKMVALMAAARSGDATAAVAEINAQTAVVNK